MKRYIYAAKQYTGKRKYVYDVLVELFPYMKRTSNPSHEVSEYSRATAGGYRIRMQGRTHNQDEDGLITSETGKDITQELQDRIVEICNKKNIPYTLKKIRIDQGRWFTNVVVPVFE